MNDSLTLHEPRRATQPLAKARQHSSAARRNSRTIRAANDADPMSCAIANGLRLGAPSLLERPDPATEARLVTLVRKRLGGLISNALSIFCGHAGAVAARLDAGERSRLQDLALTTKIHADDLVPQVAAALSPAQLVAHLAAACEAHAPNTIDLLRCREAVYSTRYPLAREAMLDQACASDRSVDTIERVVTSHVIDCFEATTLLTADTIDRLRTSCPGNANIKAEPESARLRLECDLSLQDRIIQTVRQGHLPSAVSLLAAAAGVSRATVEQAICLRTAKGLVSLAWRAGLNSQGAITIQTALGRLPPEDVLQPTETGDYPLSEPEMLWQCRFLARSQHAFA